MSRRKKEQPKYTGEEVKDGVNLEETEEEFDRREDIQRDVYRKLPEKVTCPTCGKEFDTEEDMEKHALEKHMTKGKP